MQTAIALSRSTDEKVSSAVVGQIAPKVAKPGRKKKA